MAVEQKPWAQRPEEPARAYQLFEAFRDMGSGRTIAALAKAIHVREDTMRKIAARFAWTFRADQWDAWAASARNRAAEARQLKEIDMEGKIVSDALVLARLVVGDALRAVRKDLSNKNMKSLTPAGAAQLADTVVKLARLQRGEVTDRREMVAKTARERMTAKLARMAEVLKNGDTGKAP